MPFTELKYLEQFRRYDPNCEIQNSLYITQYNWNVFSWTNISNVVQFWLFIFLACLNKTICCTYVNAQGDLIMTLALLIFDLEVTNSVISQQITIGLSLNFVHMYIFMKEDNRMFTGWIFVLAPSGASTPLVKIHPYRVNLIVFQFVQVSYYYYFSPPRKTLAPLQPKLLDKWYWNFTCVWSIERRSVDSTNHIDPGNDLEMTCI